LKGGESGRKGEEEVAIGERGGRSRREEKAQLLENRARAPDIEVTVLSEVRYVDDLESGEGRKGVGTLPGPGDGKDGGERAKKSASVGGH